MGNFQFPDRTVLEQQARRLLEQARSQAGSSVDEMVRNIGPLQPRGAGSRRSWYDWLEKPETVSLLTGLAMIHALGSEAAGDLLFGDDQADDPKNPSRMARIERRLEALAQIVERLQKASDTQRQMLSELIGVDAGEDEPATSDAAPINSGADKT